MSSESATSRIASSGVVSALAVPTAIEYTSARVSKPRPWREQYLVFGAPLIGREERDEVLACLDAGWIGSGPRVARFQDDFCEYLGARAAVAVNSCTAALHL